MVNGQLRFFQDVPAPRVRNVYSLCVYEIFLLVTHRPVVSSSPRCLDFIPVITGVGHNRARIVT